MIAMKKTTGFGTFLLRPQMLTALLAVLLTAGGLLSLLGISEGDWGKLTVQLFALFLGLCAFFAVQVPDLRLRGDRFYAILFGVNCFLLVLVLLFGEGPGNHAWIRIPWLFFDMQLSETGKVLYIVTLSYHLSSRKQLQSTWRGNLLLAGHVALPILLVLLQPDLGNALVYLAIAGAMFFFWGVRLRYAGIACGAAALAAVPMWFLLGERRQNRILSGFLPYADPLGSGWQSVAAQRAIINGSFFGKGLGNISLSAHIPALHTDMIFAAICEQFGLLGGAVTVLLLIGLCVFWILWSQSLGDSTAGLLLCGGAALIALQTIEVIGMTAGVLPIVGVTLPFISYGGSSLFSMWLLCGLIVGYTKDRKTKS